MERRTDKIGLHCAAMMPTTTVTPRHGAGARDTDRPPRALGRRSLPSAAARKNMRQLIQLRWIAVLGQAATIAAAHVWFDIPLPLDVMLALVLVLAAFNAASVLRLHIHSRVTHAEVLIALLVDIAILTAQLYCSGGITNPFVFLYLLQVTLAAVLLAPRATWIVAAVTLLCFAGLALIGQPLDLPLDHDLGLASPYVQAMLLCFALNAALLVFFLHRIQHNLRVRDARLAAIRQRAVEEEHIVRMGLLASGAAHELGTPLSTLDVILGDWRHMPEFTRDPERLQDIREMQAQVRRCKAIVTDILLSAGEARGESPSETTVHQFLDQLLAAWRSSRAPAQLVFENHFAPDVRFVADSVLTQMVCNVLDNALQASPQWVGLTATRENQHLVLTIRDAGPGFAPNMLAQLGTPYQSSKGRPGGGLGLFLSMNVARTLGGSLTAANLPEGGAQVTLRVPLAPLALEEEEP